MDKEDDSWGSSDEDEGVYLEEERSKPTSGQLSDKIGDVGVAADVDADGVFKYVLIRCKYMKEEGKEDFMLVRGYSWGEYHDDIFQEVCEHLVLKDIEGRCVGGGRINHEAATNKMKVYGYSQQYGRGNHAKAVELLQTVYPDREITWSNEGY